MQKKIEARRSIKVCEQSGYQYKATPTITFKGQWLKEFGFQIGDYVSVSCENGKLIIMQDVERAAIEKAETEFMEREKAILRKQFEAEKERLYAQFVAERKARHGAKTEDTWSELHEYKEVLAVLKAAKSVSEASDAVLTGYEKPADQSEAVKAKRAGYGQAFYEKYACNGQKPSSGGMTNADCPFLVRVGVDDLNIRKGAGTNTAKTGKYTGKGVFTVVEVRSGKGSDKGWGKLKSGTGWISLDYATKI